MSSDQVIAPEAIRASSGTVSTRGDDVTLDIESLSAVLSRAPRDQLRSPEGEQALESHEVIELQTFSERKAWIEEKIKFLEKLPPIEVFVGLDAVRSSAEVVPGLPARAELQKWLAEHDIIEKETEIFDTGELKKLRKLTKAATQRNLSPEDTDVIELTLTTIYELDKLLHLLRDRSEHLDLLGIRLTWEENRTSAWVDRRKIIEDLRTFLETRARWSPSVYEITSRPEDPTSALRRGSVTSLTSISSEKSISNPGFSRSARFKLAEVLSRDAAQFAGRVTSLRHGRITAAGKALDKLIDHSRKPVPEVLLDEQDRLEERGISELEQIGKFVMSVVMQWRKADEIYVETMKDQSSAQNLLEEIETAKLHHPTARQSASFITRADTLVKRLSLRGNPTSASTYFPCPEHPLFTEQKSANESLAQALSSEIDTAVTLVKKVDVLAKEYRTMYDAVRRVETLTQDASDLSKAFISVIERLNAGVPTSDGDGTPPNLMSEACLEPARHSVFLALLPSILEDAARAHASAHDLLRSSRAAIIDLSFPGVDPTFKADAFGEIQTLSALREQTQGARADVEARVSRLREARRIWNAMADYLKDSEDVWRQVRETMEKQRWRQQSGHGGMPPTPESPPTMIMDIDASVTELEEKIDLLIRRVSQDVDAPLSSLSGTLETPLNEWLSRSATGLGGLQGTIKQMTNLLGSIQKQAAIMSTIRDEFNDIQIRIEDLKMRVTSSIDEVLAGRLTNGDITQSELDLGAATQIIQADVTTFVDGLSGRISFVARPLSSLHTNTGLTKRRSSGELRLGGLQQHLSIELPFDLASLDDAVRADSNTFAMRLGGKLENLAQTTAHLQLARMAKEVDFSLSSTVTDINQVLQDLSGFKLSFLTILEEGHVTEPLNALAKDLETSLGHRRRISRSFSPIHEVLLRMEATPGVQDVAVREALYNARNRAVNDAEIRFKSWDEEVSNFKNQISQALVAEARRLEELRVTEEKRQEAERQRLAAVEAERVRLERERIENEEKQRLVELRLAEESRQEAERQRIAAEEAERARQQQERHDMEERQRLEEERLAEAIRLQAEKDRIATEDAERARLYRERLEMEEKLRVTEEQLAEERRRAAEVEKAEQARLARERMKAEEMENARILEEERLAIERAAAEKAEQEQFQREAERLAEQKQAERAAVEKAEQDRIRLEGERLAEERRQVADKATQQRNQEERMTEERAAKKVERTRLEGVKVEAEENGAKLLTEQRRTQMETDRTVAEETGKAQRKQQSANITNHSPREMEDVFTLRVAPSGLHDSRAQESHELKAHILALRKRLRSISINEVLRPSKPSTPLPNQDQVKGMTRELTNISVEVTQLPAASNDSAVDVELGSLKTEVEASLELMQRVVQLMDFSNSIQICDGALSDLLEHIDSFPAAPLGILASAFTPLSNDPPEEQISARLSFTRNVIKEMSSKSAVVADDQRVAAEQTRILQTWSELEEMTLDRLSGKKSRPASVISRNSSGRDSSASVSTRKAGGYANLSVSSGPSRGRFLAPAHPTTRRVVSGSSDLSTRSSSRLSSVSSTRSVSGPFSPSLYGSTFASRQRTTSLSTSAATTPVRQPIPAPLRTRAQTGQSRRSDSPALSEISSSLSRSAMGPSRSSTSMSTWSRAPRHSLSSLVPPRVSTPHRKGAAPRKTYVADPKSKLDVAVGDVVNKLPVGINVEGLSETWKDQSGKYWIGNQDPKLCFCRILRSQTVMVRVGGGWAELSKFIKDHFADSFRLVPESPPRPGAHEDKWISSSTLLEAAEIKSPPRPPRTPEPSFPFIPSFALSTPTGHSPLSMRSSPSTKGSPLTPLQFMRRADPDSIGLRPMTPSKPPRTRTAASNHATVRNSVWRP